jgi:hypothetical protein
MTTDAVKVLIVERNGIELDSQEEFNLNALTIPFTASGFVSDNVKDAIVESSVDYHSGQYLVDTLDVVTVVAKKQMRIFQKQTVDGKLINDGWLVVE